MFNRSRAIVIIENIVEGGDRRSGQRINITGTAGDRIVDDVMKLDIVAISIRLDIGALVEEFDVGRLEGDAAIGVADMLQPDIVAADMEGLDINIIGNYLGVEGGIAGRVGPLEIDRRSRDGRRWEDGSARCI